MKNHASPTASWAEINVGQRLRALRAERGLSLRALAGKSGLNVNTLSMIENGKTSPSVSTLQLIAAALEAPITAFFAQVQPLQSVVFQQRGERQSTAFAHGSMADLAAGFARAGMEPFLVSLEPGANSGATPIVHTGVEFVYCLEGGLNYEVDGQEYSLQTGDSLLFEAHLPHRWQNGSEGASLSLLLLCPADELDEPDKRHFP